MDTTSGVVARCSQALIVHTATVASASATPVGDAVDSAGSAPHQRRGQWRLPSNLLRRRLRGTVAGAGCATIVCLVALAAAVSCTWVHGDAFSLLPMRGSVNARPARGGLVRRRAAFQIDDDVENVFDQPLEELALDVRELLITDGNLFLIGPDTESYREIAKEVADLLNYTYAPFGFNTFKEVGVDIGNLERVYLVPPLISVQRWSWSMMMHGLVVWLDPDNNKKLNAFERDRVRKLKSPKKKAAFGPEKPFDVYKTDPEPPGDPIDMWNEADVHVNLVKSSENQISQTKLVLGSIINSILESPPKWRGWMRQAKAKGTIAEDFETPLQVRRNYHSYGMSTRLNRLLNA